METTSMNDSDLIKLVRAASGTDDPCSPSLKWLADLPAGTTPEQAWGFCPDATWMFWIAGKIGIDKVLIVLSACDIVETVLHLVPSGRDRPRLAIETTRAWARGEASLEDVENAANAAATASYAAYSVDAAARASAYAAVRAASYAAARAASSSSSSYASYATSAVNAANAANAANARISSLSRSADLIRVRIPWSFVAERLAAIGVVV